MYTLASGQYTRTSAQMGRCDDDDGRHDDGVKCVCVSVCVCRLSPSRWQFVYIYCRVLRRFMPHPLLICKHLTSTSTPRSTNTSNNIDTAPPPPATGNDFSLWKLGHINLLTASRLASYTIVSLRVSSHARLLHLFGRANMQEMLIML